MQHIADDAAAFEEPAVVADDLAGDEIADGCDARTLVRGDECLVARGEVIRRWRRRVTPVLVGCGTKFPNWAGVSQGCVVKATPAGSRTSEPVIVRSSLGISSEMSHTVTLCLP